MLRRLEEDGVLRGEWRSAMLTAPRHLFVPDRAWYLGDDGLKEMDRAVDPQEWLRLAYDDAPVITQFDEGETPAGDRGRTATSSISMPSLVAKMLDALDVSLGARVLEIGTGTGWNCALLCARLGDAAVTSIEIDAAVADRARRNLSAVGMKPQVITGDGEKGMPDSAPYDRLIATVAAHCVPHAWVDQVNPGGVIVTPFNTKASGSLLRLKVAGDGTATGKFCGNAAFMPLRSQRPTDFDIKQYVTSREYTESRSGLYPYEPLSDYDGNFSVSLLMPDVEMTVHVDGDDAFPFTCYLVDTATGSWASERVEAPDEKAYVIRQHGPRRLWSELEEAYQWWCDHEKPSHERFGVTVTPDRQSVWLDTPERLLHP